MTSQAKTAPDSTTTDSSPPPPRRRWAKGKVGQTHPLVALLWLSPALALIFGVVLYPAVKLFQASRGDYSITGLRVGDAGWSNYADVLDHRALWTVLANTGYWVVTVVLFTIVISLALAQLLVQEFPGRRFVRWAIIVPWAASLIITSQLFVLLYDYNYGMINQVLTSVGLLDTPIDFLGDDAWTMPAMIAVGILVSVPFTVFVFIAGLNAIPGEMMEAAKVDGASAWQRYRLVTLPLMKSAMLVAAVLNVIYVFNSFPIVYTLNDRNPGFSTDTSITFMYKLAFESQDKDVGMSAAMGIMNVLIILAAIAVYLKVVNWKEETR
ncbi:MAG: sugar ABC transporter permease [Ornithinimicrobium sp.]